MTQPNHSSLESQNDVTSNEADIHSLSIEQRLAGAMQSIQETVKNNKVLVSIFMAALMLQQTLKVEASNDPVNFNDSHAIVSKSAKPEKKSVYENGIELGENRSSEDRESILKQVIANMPQQDQDDTQDHGRPPELNAKQELANNTQSPTPAPQVDNKERGVSIEYVRQAEREAERSFTPTDNETEKDFDFENMPSRYCAAYKKNPAPYHERMKLTIDRINDFSARLEQLRPTLIANSPQHEKYKQLAARRDQMLKIYSDIIIGFKDPTGEVTKEELANAFKRMNKNISKELNELELKLGEVQGHAYSGKFSDFPETIKPFTKDLYYVQLSISTFEQKYPTCSQTEDINEDLKQKKEKLKVFSEKIGNPDSYKYPDTNFVSIKPSLNNNEEPIKFTQEDLKKIDKAYYLGNSKQIGKYVLIKIKDGDQEKYGLVRNGKKFAKIDDPDKTQVEEVGFFGMTFLNQGEFPEFDPLKKGEEFKQQMAEWKKFIASVEAAKRFRNLMVVTPEGKEVPAGDSSEFATVNSAAYSWVQYSERIMIALRAYERTVSSLVSTSEAPKLEFNKDFNKPSYTENRAFY